MPSELKKLVEQVRIAEANTKEQKKVLRAFKAEHKLILRRSNVLEERIYKLKKENEICNASLVYLVIHL